MVRTRFAPSPTGELHLGNARIAVLNWLFARHSGGRFLIRIEDTDVERNVSGAEREILADLRDLGLDWDEGPVVGGEFGPYRQSERATIYAERARRLLDAGRAYRCYCSPEELEARKRAAVARGGPPRYDGRCRDLDEATIERLRSEGRPGSIRFAVEPGEIIVRDAVRGDVVFDARETGDFVILKSDGLPTYNFAVAVDDNAMQISHVIRGVGHLANTPRQVMVYRALGAAPPIFVHVPHVLGPDGAPLSKRHGARSQRDYLELGYHPDALINYLSLLSWSSPSGDEVLTRERLIAEIDLARLGASDVRLDPEKLEWLSGEHIRRMSPERLAERLASHLGPGRLPDSPPARVRLASAIRERITTFGAAESLLPQFDPPNPMRWSPEAERALSEDGAPGLLSNVREALAELKNWSGEAAIEAVRAAGKEAGMRGRALFMPVRAAISGEVRGPELVDLLEIQGRETALRVLAEAEARARALAGGR